MTAPIVKQEVTSSLFQGTIQVTGRVRVRASVVKGNIYLQLARGNTVLKHLGPLIPKRKDARKVEPEFVRQYLERRKLRSK
jgi:hypothetical protein